MTIEPEAVALRLSMADGPDREAVLRLAALDGSPPPQGLVAIADVDGRPVAALGFADGDAVADRERAGPAIITLLHVHRWALRGIAAVWGC
jgi:hypothetical protein